MFTPSSKRSSESPSAPAGASGWQVWEGTQFLDGYGECSLVAYDTGRTETGQVIQMDAEDASNPPKIRIDLTVTTTNEKARLEFSYDEFEPMFEEENDFANQTFDSERRFDWLSRRLVLTDDTGHGLVLAVHEKEASRSKVSNNATQSTNQQLDKQGRRTGLEAKRQARIAEIERSRSIREAKTAARLRAEMLHRTEQTRRRLIDSRKARDDRITAAKDEEARLKFEMMKLDMIRQDNIKRREVKSLSELL